MHLSRTICQINPHLFWVIGLVSKGKETEVTHLVFSKLSTVLRDIFIGRTGKHRLDETITARCKNN